MERPPRVPLVGRRRGAVLDVLHAVPFQGATRGHHGVAVGASAERRVLALLGGRPDLELLGDFHSHAQFGTAKGVERPSVEDEGGLAPGQVSVIVAVNDGRRRRPFTEREDGTLEGAVSGFALRLGAFALDARGRVVPVALRCSYALDAVARGSRAGRLHP